MMLCKVIGVRKPDNKEWIGRTVWRLGDVKAGTEYPTAIVKEDGWRCVYGAQVVMFHPDDLEEVTDSGDICGWCDSAHCDCN